MEFFVVLFQTAVKMVLLAGVAVGGIRLGKVLRDRKDAKLAAQAAAEAEQEETK